MELNFIKCGDYYIPDIKVKNPNIRLGKWGRMRKEYLRLANPVLFSDMVLNETLYEHCAEIEETAKKRMEIIVPQLAKAYGVTEQLKAENQIEWVRQPTLRALKILSPLSAGRKKPIKCRMKPIRQTACDNACSAVLPIRWTFCPLTEAATVDFCLSWYTPKMQRFTFWKMKPHPERSLI